MSRSSFTITPEELVTFHSCLSSKLCTRIFQILLSNNVLNITAIARKARCGNNEALRHLKNLARLRIVNEDFYAGRHTFTLNMGEFTELMKQAIRAIEERERENLVAQ